MYSIAVHLMNAETVIFTGYDSISIAREAAKVMAKNGVCYEEQNQYTIYPALQIEKLVVSKSQ